MRTEFHQQLHALNSDLTRMCELAGEAMQRATVGLLTVDLEAAERVLSDLEVLNRMRREVDHAALALLARQAPVASDLRLVVAAVHITSDADRMGGLAAHVARIVRRRHPDPVLPNEVVGQFSEMGSLAVDLAEDAASVIIDGDPVRASRIRDDDEAMNAMHRRLFSTVMSPDWSHGVPAAIDLVLLGRFYERFADHAVAIAARVLFRSTGDTTRDLGQ
ncbi:Phosphate-specific transport system accessory protein PhoU [Mycolicibacterium vanbaalenii]|uniref:Phosphate-specific transport system accessory protein PhoU n=1 Tax=Mycolicibacterium vanbaalenii TaxID=110539 RepID=A0A5S9R989_MYCVN|nr:phosphate signaling complex protein PhoU [Mycolicibacterium vanbaalenii]CAA0134126.1 Phosphate-specific transport system accessory protein PhoU [Mycolicibacterium vanbaalenii]